MEQLIRVLVQKVEIVRKFRKFMQARRCKGVGHDDYLDMHAHRLVKLAITPGKADDEKTREYKARILGMSKRAKLKDRAMIKKALHPGTGTVVPVPVPVYSCRYYGTMASHYPTIGAHGDWSSDWSVFQLDWTENWLTMSVNGKLYVNYDRNASGGERLPALNRPMFLWLTACVMNRVLPTADNIFPLEYLVDYVKVDT
eukprot:COSAG05_NODE_2083_length_3598_cov_2.077451_2_plen_199_part_00